MEFHELIPTDHHENDQQQQQNIMDLIIVANMMKQAKILKNNTKKYTKHLNWPQEPNLTKSPRIPSKRFPVPLLPFARPPSNKPDYRFDDDEELAIQEDLGKAPDVAVPLEHSPLLYDHLKADLDRTQILFIMRQLGMLLEKCHETTACLEKMTSANGRVVFALARLHGLPPQYTHKH